MEAAGGMADESGVGATDARIREVGFGYDISGHVEQVGVDARRGTGRS